MNTAGEPAGHGNRSIAGEVARVLEMIKFSHTLFALPFAILAALLAAREGGHWVARWRDWAGILACMVTARSCAMAFNRLVDRKIDARNPRTAGRHLPTGELSVASVAAFTVANGLAFVASTALFWPNPWPLILSGPVLAWLLGYSMTKRFTSLAHYWLGVALGLAPMSAWLAIRGTLGLPPAWLGLAVATWVGGFDIIYACQDVDFDRDHRLRSIPARLGVPGALRVAALSHLVAVLALVGLGLAYPLGTVYFAGVGLIAILLAYEHMLVKPGDFARINLAFFQVNIAVSIGLLVAGATDLLLHRA